MRSSLNRNIFVGPIGIRPYFGFFLLLLLLLLLLLAVSESSINSLIYAISALQPTYHISPVRGQRQGSSGDDQDNDKDAHKDEYKDKDKDRTFKKKVFLYI